nr:hypothetical protein [Tanacetum cinerariifolium]
MSYVTIEQLIAQRVADAIAAYKVNQNNRNGTQNEASGSTDGEDIQGKVSVSKPNKIQEAIRMAHDLTDQVVRSKVAKDVNNKRKWKDEQGGNPYQQQTKRQEVVRAMLLDHVKRKDMLELYHSAAGATFIITSVPIPLNVVTAGRSITKQETAGPLLRELSRILGSELQKLRRLVVEGFSGGDVFVVVEGFGVADLSLVPFRLLYLLLIHLHDDTPLIPTETPTILHVVSTLPRTSPFLYTDSSDSDTFERPPSQDLYEVTVARWRSRVAAHSPPPSPPTLPMKSVGPLPFHRLALRYLESHSPSDHFSPDDFSPDTSLGSSSCYSSNTSSGHSIPYSSFDSPAASIAVPSHKRRRSSIVSVPLATLVPGALSLAYIDANTTAAEVTTAREAYTGVRVDIRIDREDDVKEEDESSHIGTIKIGVDTVVELVVSEDIPVPTDDEDSRERSAVMLDRIGVLERDNMRMRGMLCVERKRVDSLRRHMSHTQEELRQIRVSRFYDRAEFKRLKNFAMRRLGYHP